MDWKIDPVHSHVGFAVKHMMIATVRGEFRSYSGTISLDPDDPTRSHVTGEIDVASLHTRDETRDTHLRSAEFFDVDHYPTIAFESRRIERIAGDRYRVIGDLTIRGVKREVTLEAEFAGIRKDPWGATRAGFAITGSVDRKEFGLTWNAALEAGGFMVGDQVKIDIDAEAVLQAVPAMAT